MWETSHPLSFAVAGYALAASIMPNLVLIAAGHLVGTIPAASAAGLGSAAGHRLILALAVTGALYAAALLLGPVQSSLSSVSCTPSCTSCRPGPTGEARAAPLGPPGPGWPP